MTRITDASGARHRIEFTVDPIRQEPVIKHDVTPGDRKNGTSICMKWPDSACSILADARDRFLQIADDYAWLNPHLRLAIDWFGEQRTIEATDPTWQKWGPSDPTSAHWYTPQHLERLIAGYIAHDQDNGRERTVRELVAEFRGLSGSAKQKKVLDDTGLHRAPLSSLVTETGIDTEVVIALLTAMKAHSKPVKPPALGVIGKDHLRRARGVATGVGGPAPGRGAQGHRLNGAPPGVAGAPPAYGVGGTPLGGPPGFFRPGIKVIISVLSTR